MWQKLFQQELNSYFDRKKKKNASFSLRRMAMRIKMSPGAVSEILRGRRRVSSDKALEIIALLEAEDGRYFPQLKEAIELPTISQNQISLETEDILRRFHYFATLSVLETQDVVPSAIHVGKALRISCKDAERALKQLVRNGFAIEREDGSFCSSGQLWLPNSKVPFSVNRDDIETILKESQSQEPITRFEQRPLYQLLLKLFHMEQWDKSG